MAKKVLITRFSSLGDVALLVPVVYAVAVTHPNEQFTVVTRKEFAFLFKDLNLNVYVRSIDLKKEHKGLMGGIRLALKLKSRNYTHIADVHDVLRTKLIRLLSFSSQKSIIDKGRKEKTEVIKSKQTDLPLMHVTDRYMQVFKRLDLGAPISEFKTIFEAKNIKSDECYNIIKNKIPEKNGFWIGIAPFAKHESKIYPLPLLEELLFKLSEQAKRDNITVFLFGGGSTENKIMEGLKLKFPELIKFQGKLKLKEELAFMSYLDLMITMDSANMHLASLVKIPVVSIWGATHPSMGFLGYGQDLNNVVQANVECRPCSVFGEAECRWQGEEKYKCLKRISPDMILDKVNSILQAKEKNDEVASK